MKPAALAIVIGSGLWGLTMLPCIVLKAAGVIAWPWSWVLALWWLPLVGMAVALLGWMAGRKG